jgi:hypothetical protein
VLHALPISSNGNHSWKWELVFPFKYQRTFLYYAQFIEFHGKKPDVANKDYIYSELVHPWCSCPSDMPPQISGRGWRWTSRDISWRSVSRRCGIINLGTPTPAHVTITCALTVLSRETLLLLWQEKAAV